MANVNNDIYETYGERWYSAYDDPVALLRAESKTKTPWVIEKINKHFPQKNIQLLDVGCGGGFLSNALAQESYQVTGIDLSEESLKVAAKFDQTKTVKYQVANAYQLPFADQSFDVITAMDFLEHIDDPQKAIHEFARVLKPGGLFIYHTFNRNWLSYLVVIKMVEWLVQNTPKNMHVLSLFIKPAELAQYCLLAGMNVQDVTGIKPIFSTIPLRNVFSGVVPESLRFELTASTLLSYMGYAVKN